MAKQSGADTRHAVEAGSYSEANFVGILALVLLGCSLLAGVVLLLAMGFAG
jgi:hypothetical protein